MEEVATNDKVRAAKNLADAGREKLSGIADKVTDRVIDAGESLQNKASEAAGCISSSVSKGVSQVQDYISNEGLGGFVNDLKGLIKRYPVQTAIAGVGVGYLISRCFASNEEK